MSQNNVITPIDEAALPEIDLRGEAFQSDPKSVLKATLAKGPIARSRRGIELLSYELISEEFLDETLDTPGPEHYERLGAGEELLWFVDSGLLSTMTRARHDPIRRIMLKAFSFKNIEAQRATARSVAEKFLNEWIDDGQADLIGQLTEYYPIQVMSQMVGIPIEDIPRFSEAAHHLHLLAAVPMAPGFPQIEVALDELKDYVRRLVAKRRENPQDDFVSAFLAAQESQSKLSEDELVGNIVNLIFAGMGTTTKQLASAVHDIVGAGLWEHLHEKPEIAQDLISESLRYAPVTQFVVRIAQEDTVIRDYSFPKGTRLIFNLLAASRDPEKFPNPDVFDYTRDTDESRLPFGWGVHRCLGQPLARLLMEEALKLLSERLTDVQIVSRDRGPQPAEMLGGSTTMTISFRRR